MRFEYADGRMPVAMTKGGSRYYLAYDQVGSLRAVTDASGNAVKRIEYDAFGNIVNADQQEYNADFGVPFGFAGGLYDADTGLVRFGYRDYDPDTGRWTAKDPILFAGGDTDLYGYCLSDPVNLVDPTGELGFNLSKKVWNKIVKKHILGTKPAGTMFNQDASTVKKLIQKTISDGNKVELGGKYGTQFTKDFKQSIGTKGETIVKVVVKNGKIRTAYPIAGAVLGFIGGLFDPFDAISGELADGELPYHLRYPENSPCN